MALTSVARGHGCGRSASWTAGACLPAWVIDVASGSIKVASGRSPVWHAGVCCPAWVAWVASSSIKEAGRWRVTVQVAGVCCPAGIIDVASCSVEGAGRRCPALGAVFHGHVCPGHVCPGAAWPVVAAKGVVWHRAGAGGGISAVSEVVAVGSEELEVSVLSGVAWRPSLLTAAAVVITPAIIMGAPASVLLSEVTTSVTLLVETVGVVVADAASRACAPIELSLVDSGFSAVFHGHVCPGHVCPGTARPAGFGEVPGDVSLSAVFHGHVCPGHVCPGTARPGTVGLVAPEGAVCSVGGVVAKVGFPVSVVLGIGWLPVILAAAAVLITPATIGFAPTCVVHGVLTTAGNTHVGVGRVVVVQFGSVVACTPVDLGHVGGWVGWLDSDELQCRCGRH